MPELLIGAGAQRKKHLSWNDNDEWTKLVTLDINPDHKPDVVWDLNDTELPFEDDTFDEIHAYEVLEHTGQQGDWRFFFSQWSHFWRVLKPGGLFIGTSPSFRAVWAWGDPGHTRVVQEENFVFLHQPSYTAQVGVRHMTDYRFVYEADFEPLALNTGKDTFQFVLQAVKPSRITR
jgi:SAM-dependent methyltransferase